MISTTTLSVFAAAFAVAAQDMQEGPETPIEHLEVLALLGEGEAAMEAGGHAELRHVLNQWDRLGVQGFDGEPSTIAEAWSAAAQTGEDTPPVRGAVQGPGVHRGVLESGELAELTRAYYAGRVARITLGAPRGASLELRIQESDGGPTVCEPTLQSGPVTCEWTPIWTSDYVIEVRNLADGSARYRLVSN